MPCVFRTVEHYMLNPAVCFFYQLDFHCANLQDAYGFNSLCVLNGSGFGQSKSTMQR